MYIKNFEIQIFKYYQFQWNKSVFVYLCICVFVYLCICVFVYLCICVCVIVILYFLVPAIALEILVTIVSSTEALFVHLYLYLCICFCVFFLLHLDMLVAIDASREVLFWYLYLCICVFVFVHLYLCIFVSVFSFPCQKCSLQLSRAQRHCLCSVPWSPSISVSQFILPMLGSLEWEYWLEYYKEEKSACSRKIILIEWKTDRWVIFFLISRNRPVIQTWATYTFWNLWMWCKATLVLIRRVMTILRMMRRRCSWSCVF